MVNAIVWIVNNGFPWRNLPECYGSWKSVYSRFRKWIEDDILDNIFWVLSLGAKLEEPFLDMTNVKTHQHSVGAKKELRNKIEHSWGRHQNPCRSRYLWIFCI